MKLIAKNDLVVESASGVEQWIIGLYDDGGYNVCQVDMLAGPEPQPGEREDCRMAPAVLAHYHEQLTSMEQQEICSRLCGAIESAFGRHPEDLAHYHHVIEHETPFLVDV